jgi:hypothetical protein
VHPSIPPNPKNNVEDQCPSYQIHWLVYANDSIDCLYKVGSAKSTQVNLRFGTIGVVEGL